MRLLAVELNLAVVCGRRQKGFFTVLRRRLHGAGMHIIREPGQGNEALLLQVSCRPRSDAANPTATAQRNHRRFSFALAARRGGGRGSVRRPRLVLALNSIAWQHGTGFAFGVRVASSSRLKPSRLRAQLQSAKRGSLAICSFGISERMELRRKNGRKMPFFFATFSAPSSRRQTLYKFPSGLILYLCY